jgi:hypothetical protein
VNRLLQDAANIFEAAAFGAQSGQPPSDTAILVGADGSIRIVCGSDWPTDGLRRLHGTSAAFRVTAVDGAVRVTGEDGHGRCFLEAHSPARVIGQLLGREDPRIRQLALNPPHR